MPGFLHNLGLAEGSVPPSLQGWKLWCLPLGSLVAGTKLRGQFEEKVQKLLAVVKQTKAILFLDEAHLRTRMNNNE